MPTLILKFGIVLEKRHFQRRHAAESGREQHGPLFHKWLPLGEEDALSLVTGDPDASFKVWFDRLGFVEGGHLIFDYKRRELDAETISKENVLDAGPLRGRLELRNVSEDELVAIQENRWDDELYIRVGKRVLKLVHPVFSRLIDILRTKFGQHWLSKLEPWDSRTTSLGAYLNSDIFTEWSVDNGATWNEFIPTQLRYGATMFVRPAIRGYTEYLCEEDWKELEKLVNEPYEPPTSAYILTSARAVFDQKQFKHSLIEGVTALEMAINEFVLRRIDGEKVLLSKIQTFWGLPLPAQVTIIAAISNIITIEETISATKAIETRNQIVHEGTSPSQNDLFTIALELLDVVAKLIWGGNFKFPAYERIGASDLMKKKLKLK